MYIWTSSRLQTAISTDDRQFALQLKRWAERRGYRVEMPEDVFEDGPDDP